MQNMQIFVETNRLTLRELMPSDETGMFELDADAEVHRYLGNKPISTMDEVRQVIALIRDQYVQNGIGRWAVIEKATGHFMGWSGLKLVKELINGHINYYDLGYRLMKKHWNAPLNRFFEIF
jgi:RimJ/RimL family protein N-acetyltransferase